MEVPSPDHARPPSGKLAENIMHFARVLREAGLPVGPGSVLDALDAAQCGALHNRDDFYWMLHSVLVKRHEHSALFDQAFHVFWRKPKMLEQLMQMFFQQIQVQVPAKDKKAGYRRLANAMFDEQESQSRREEPPGDIELEGDYTASAREILQQKDFEQMSVAEEAEARRAIARMRLHRLTLATRRFDRSPAGNLVDMRASLARSMRAGGDMVRLVHRKRRRREPPLVVICDISGSMANYSRMFLHFLHALTNDRDRVHVFVFGTRLTNITRELDRRDVDDAMDRVTKAVADWSGGTRIGDALREFNFRWSRRVLTQGAHVLLMTDGLERDDIDLLSHEMERLHRSARRVVWLNPLLRYAGFEARAAGINAMMPHVDEFRPVHSLDCLDDLAQALTMSRKGEHNPARWLRSAA